VKSTAGSRIVAERYARATLAVALDKKVDLDRLAREIAGLAALLERETKLASVLASPAIPEEKRIAVVDEVLGKPEPTGETRRLVHVLVRNERIALLGELAAAFRRLVLEHKQIQPGEVVSAHALTDGQRARLAERLGKALGKTMELSYRTDPGIVGGLVVRVGNRVFDASVRTQLERFKEKALASF
jgi:F-type H+-transporting ATPase subunit delta